MNNTPTGKDYVGSDDLYADVQRTMRLAAEMNTGYHTEAEVRDYMRQITGSDIEETLRIFTPFHINYGKKTTFGRDCFVNFGCTFLALGGLPSRTMFSSGRIACWPQNTIPKTPRCAIPC